MVVSEKIGIFVAEITKHNSNMGKNIIEIGTKIKVNIQNKDIIGAVTNIQRCECGEKYGEDIDSVKLSEAQKSCDYDYTISLDCNKWCYGEQVKEIID